MAYVVVTVGILAVLLLQLRADTLSAAEKLISSLARHSSDETSHALQSVDQTLTIADTILEQRERNGSLSQRAMAAEFRALLRDRPYLRSLAVVGPNGRIVYHSADQGVGLDMSDRPFFRHHLEVAGDRFHISLPFRSRLSDAWILPATRVWLDDSGAFRGIILATVDPQYFADAWSKSEWGRDVFIALFNRNEELLLRSPFKADAMGRRLAPAWSIPAWRAGERAGTGNSTSPLDGVERIVAFRALSIDPFLYVIVGQSVRETLAPWRHIVGVVALGWMLTTLGLAVLGTWLVGEWEARKSTEERYRHLFEANPDPIAVVDLATRRYLGVNEAMVRKYGWSREEFREMTAREIRPPEERPVIEAAIARASPGTPEIVEGHHRRKDGTGFDVEVSLTRIEFEGRPAILTMARDVSLRVAADREHREAEEKVRQLQKMEAVGQLTGGVAHDFNNILMVVMANTDALEEDYALPLPVREHVQNIARATRRAADLTRQLLAFSRKQPLQPQVIDLNNLVLSTTRLLRRTLGERIVLDTTLAPDVWPVNVDRTQLETALVNLCLNARDAMPDGGRILLETSERRIGEAEAARLPEMVAGDYVMLAVTDTGIGIRQENIDKVFEPFFTTKEVGRGTGLGLSMVYGFVKQSRGHVTIDSAPGRGTTVTLFLRRHEGAFVASPAGSPPTPRGLERLLVVEDDDDVRANLVDHLEALGYVVDQAASGDAAITICEKADAPYDLVLSDVVMPGRLGGREMAQEMRRRWPHLPVVFMSGYTEDATSRDGKIPSDMRLLNKPFRRQELASFVRDALVARRAAT